MDEMKASSTIIHKGKREEKYKICVEDYVMSYLQRESGNLELSEIFFYGHRLQNGKRYEIYGAGKDRNISFFDKYELLEEIVCRQTQAGPFFLVKEGSEAYEVQGYDVFYQKNEEMQEYMVASKKEAKLQQINYRKERRTYRIEESPTVQREENSKRMQGLISLQLCAIFILLTAIVITSTNSYDKMGELGQSAKEVFFAMENQAAQEKNTVSKENGKEAEAASDVEKTDDMSAVLEENAAGTETAPANGEVIGTEEISEKDKVDNEELSGKEESAAGSEKEQTKEGDEQEEGLLKNVETGDGEMPDEEEGTEALSRSVTRYYEIKKGDTLFTISLKIYGDTSKVKQICELNQIEDPDNIRYGQKIILP